MRFLLELDMHVCRRDECIITGRASEANRGKKGKENNRINIQNTLNTSAYSDQVTVSVARRRRRIGGATERNRSQIGVIERSGGNAIGVR